MDPRVSTEIREDSPDDCGGGIDLYLGVNLFHALTFSQALRRKGISLLRFLLSGETDLETLLSSYRRR